MKLFYNKNSKDPIYYAQVGIRNGKKVTTRNVKRFGKHSELLEITDDPLSYVKEEIRKMNEEYDKLDRERKSSQSHLFSYPIPVYMTDKCAEFCKRCTAIAKIISSMDAVFISRNSEIMDFILQSANKKQNARRGYGKYYRRNFRFV